MKTKARWLIAVIVVLLLPCLSVTVHAEEELPTADTYVEELMDALPDEVKDLLPEGSGEEIAKGVDEAYLLSVSFEILKAAFSDFTGYLTLFLGIILIAAFADRLDMTFGKEIGNTVSYLVILLVAYEVYSILYSLYSSVSLYITRLEGFLSTLVAVMGSITLLGGGAVQATTVSVTLTSILAVIGGVISAFLFPIIEISFAANLTSVVSKRVNLSSFSDFLRNVFMYAIGFISMIAVVVLTFQTVLAGAEDTLSARSIRFAASSAIPIVGGAVGDSVKILAASVDMVKKSVGTVGMIGLVIMVLYPLSQLFSASIAISLSKAVSGILGVTSLDSIFHHSQKSIQMLLAVVSMLGILFLFAIGLYAFSAVPLEGAA